MSHKIDRAVVDIVDYLIPVVKKRMLIALDRSREVVEFEIITLAGLFTVRDGLGQSVGVILKKTQRKAPT